MKFYTGVVCRLFDPGVTLAQAFSRDGLLKGDVACVGTCACLGFGAFTGWLLREGFFLSEHYWFQRCVQDLRGPSLQGVSGGRGLGVIPREFLHFQVAGWLFLGCVGVWS